MKSQPFFSIVMPTRNRAELLYYALKSAQTQEFDDFEIVVSNNNSSDDTEEVVMGNIDNHTRYIATDKTMSMPDHWDFALEHAKGEYVLFLCDDDALRPDLLKFLFQVIKKRNPYCVSWMNGVYFHHDWYERARINSLCLESYSNKQAEINSKTLLKNLFNVKWREMSVPLPKMLNSCCKREVLNKVKVILGKTFLPPNPDYSIATAILTLIPSVLFIESPCFVCGVSKKGIGANLDRRGKAHMTFNDEIGGKSMMFQHTLLTCITMSNTVVENILKIKFKMPEQLKCYDLSLINYFMECKKDLDESKQLDVDISTDIEEFYAVLEKQDDKIKEYVLAAIKADEQRQKQKDSIETNKHERVQSNIISILKNNLPTSLRNRLSKTKSMILSAISSKNKKILYPQSGRYNGSEYGFSNIFECAYKLKEWFPLSEIDS